MALNFFFCLLSLVFVWFFGAMTSHLENIEYYKTRTEMYRVIGQEYVDNYEEHFGVVSCGRIQIDESWCLITVVDYHNT